MPIASDDSADLMKHLQSVGEMSKGDLFLKFAIQFPQKLKENYKQIIVKALKDNEEEFE